MFWRYRYLLIFLFAACIAAASDQPAAIASHAASSHVPARRITVVGVSNFGEVTPHLFRGGQPKLAGYQHLKQMGIDLVVDLRLSGEENEKKDVNKAGMKFVSLKWHCMFPHDEVFAKFLELLRDNPNKKIFVHCRYGDDRTGMMIAAYRMADEGWTPGEARKEMEKFGFHRLVCPRLGPYEKHFPEHLKNGSTFKDPQNHTAESH
jgi:tyrosine-protein phosphatase SIW14